MKSSRFLRLALMAVKSLIGTSLRRHHIQLMISFFHNPAQYCHGADLNKRSLSQRERAEYRFALTDCGLYNL